MEILTEQQFGELCRWYLTHADDISEWLSGFQEDRIAREKMFRGWKSGGKVNCAEIICLDAAFDLGFPITWKDFEQARAHVIINRQVKNEGG